MILDQTFTFAVKHRDMKSYLLSMLQVALFSLNCVAQEAIPLETAAKISNDDFRQLCGFMTGSFSSEAQSKNDSAFDDVRMHTIPIWPESKDGYWLYVEQAIASKMKKPYRQFFYRIVKKDEYTIECILYTISNPLRFAGAWEKPELLTAITRDSLETESGCSILIKQVAPGIFEGSTMGKSCLNKHMGATYATSQLTVNSRKMVLWDKGYNRKGKQVWGAETKGYVFLKDGAE